MEINKPIATVVIFIINLVLVFLFVIPKYQELKVTTAALREKQGEYEGKSAYYEKIAILSKSIDSRKEVLEKIDSALPSQVAFAPLVNFLQKKGAETGLVIKSITFSQTSDQASPKTNGAEAASKLKEIGFSMSILGNYQGLKNFLGSLERSARLFEVQTIAFSLQQASQKVLAQGAQLQTYNFKLDVKTHSY